MPYIKKIQEHTHSPLKVNEREKENSVEKVTEDVPKRDYATVRNEMANAKKGSDEWYKLAKELEGTTIVRKNVKKTEQVGKII